MESRVRPGATRGRGTTAGTFGNYGGGSLNRGDDEMEIRLLRGEWLTTEELARVLGVDCSTVRRWRTSRPVQGPPFVQLSERVTMYSAYDVEQWLRSRRIDPSEAA